MGTILRLVTCLAVSLVTARLGQAESSTPTQSAQEMITLPVRVVDVQGQPVADVTVIPWDLRCSQGHGQWRLDGKGGSIPPTLKTDSDGAAVVPYPRFTDADEFVRTTEVTLSLDHPEFAYLSHEYINVPRADTAPHTVKLERGARVEIAPIENGKPAPLDGLYALWSDGRSWKSGVQVSKTEDGALRIPNMPAGKGQVLIVRLDGERVTHFSPIVDLELQNSATMREKVELRPAVRIEGALSNDVPRPVRHGRVVGHTLPNDSEGEHVLWFDWAPVTAEGTFVIEAWPAGEAVQIIALCDGYIAESGTAPAVVDDPHVSSAFQRPQVFAPEELDEQIAVRMTPLVRCVVETVNELGAPVPSVKVASNPNVLWWNCGSQIYCHPLVNGRRLLIERDYRKIAEGDLAMPFTTVTDASGRGELQLPVHTKGLYAEHADYELPIVLGRGRREHRIALIAGETTSARLVLQPKGTERIGEWDKLAGVLFGCTGEQCQRLLNDPGFRAKMDVVRQVLDSAKDPTDPAVLTVAYTATAAAFDELDDKEEAAQWRLKAAQQVAKLLGDGGDQRADLKP